MALKIVKPLVYTERTLTRASVGRYFDTADGLNKSMAVNLPRFDKYEGVLVEPAATNILLQSQDTSQAAWVKAGANTSTTPLVVDPAGTTLANTTTAAQNTGIGQTVAVSSATSYAFTCMIKAGSASAFKIGQFGGTPNTVEFNTSTKTFSNPSGVVSYQYKELVNSWFVIEIIFTSTNTSAVMDIRPTASGSNTYYVWGCQLETGTKATSYIVTTTVAVARSADVASTYGMISEVAEGTTAAWSNVTAYIAGDLVYYLLASSTYKVYQCSTGHTGQNPTSTSGFWNLLAQTDYPLYNVGTAYTVGQRVMLAATHMVYECVIANTGNLPNATGSTFWKTVAATNRWAMLDTVISTQTAKTTKLSFSFRSAGITNSIGFMNVSGDSIRVRVRDATEGIVYDKTVALTGPLIQPTWYDYFFSTGLPSTQAVFTDLPPYLDGTITVDVLGTTCAIGACVAGYAINFGMGVQYGASVGIQDYSIKQKDAYGETTFLQRGFAKRISMNMLLDNSEVDSTLDALASLRAVPALWIGNADFNSTVVYGFYKDFNIVIAYPTASECSIEVEGLL